MHTPSPSSAHLPAGMGARTRLGGQSRLQRRPNQELDACLRRGCGHSAGAITPVTATSATIATTTGGPPPPARTAMQLPPYLRHPHPHLCFLLNHPSYAPDNPTSVQLHLL
eukprot:scaffold2113_cov119-Isochrysis_galbana.AAC.1